MKTSSQLLRDCIENSVKKQGIEFAEDYGKFGLWSDPFSNYEYPLSSNLDISFIDRVKEIENLSKNLVNSFLGKGEDVAIIGAEGIGARSLVNLFKDYAYSLENEEDNSINMKIKGKLQDIFVPKASTVNEDILSTLKTQIEFAIKQKKTILVLSSFDEKENLIGKTSPTRIQYRRLLEMDRFSHDLTIFFSPWNATAFDYMLEEEFSAASIYEDIVYLEPLDKRNTINLLKTRLKMFSNEETKKINLFSDDGIGTIAEYSGGIPKFALKFSSIILNEAIASKRSSSIDKKYVETTLNLQGYKSYSEVSNDLKILIPRHWWETKHGKIRTEMKILKYAILIARPSTSTEIGKLIGKSRVAVLENLKKLEKAGIISYTESQNDSRKRPFIVNDFAKSIFEHEFIIPEIKKRIENQ